MPAKAFEGSRLVVGLECACGGGLSSSQGAPGEKCFVVVVTPSVPVVWLYYPALGPHGLRPRWRGFGGGIIGWSGLSRQGADSQELYECLDVPPYTEAATGELD